MSSDAAGTHPFSSFTDSLEEAIAFYASAGSYFLG
jgi:hypothetical protein